ncbi:helix-turn-helix transcriptional regulator [Flavobacterium sp. CYK-4]|uniref:helix-turn-helix domain-containing protein n=1 Tax=Flavobacterium lotistagni TaxID=2709660 RepID=UPI0014099E49|nr:helix-turn-helix transcriptional regulator [Flavobacterium lotistagni]NHM08040.1 helix-turn-helix transcriptional regulator [Flavobacterium lotistagni]
MKKENPIRHLLGVTQLEAAMLLGISRSQWSMFESGKRDLPLPAQQLLAEMLAFVQSAEQQPERRAHARAQQIANVELKLRELAFQQMRLQREIVKIEREAQWQARRELLEDFLVQRQHSKSTPVVVRVVLFTGNKIATEVLLAQIEKQKHRNELLELEKLLLESQLRKLGKSLENTGGEI